MFCVQLLQEISPPRSQPPKRLKNVTPSATRLDKGAVPVRTTDGPSSVERSIGVLREGCLQAPEGSEEIQREITDLDDVPDEGRRGGRKKTKKHSHTDKSRKKTAGGSRKKKDKKKQSRAEEGPGDDVGGSQKKKRRHSRGEEGPQEDVGGGT